MIPSHASCRSITLRRTASWGSRNAFSDGHISDFDQAATLPGRMNRAVTRPHQYRRQSHQLARSGTWLDQQVCTLALETCWGLPWSGQWVCSAWSAHLPSCMV